MIHLGEVANCLMSVRQVYYCHFAVVFNNMHGLHAVYIIIIYMNLLYHLNSYVFMQCHYTFSE